MRIVGIAGFLPAAVVVRHKKCPASRIVAEVDILGALRIVLRDHEEFVRILVFFDKMLHGKKRGDHAFVFSGLFRHVSVFIEYAFNAENLIRLKSLIIP